jgi:hypothetical protein
MQRLIQVMLLTALCGGASAQSLYKCTVNGKVTYTGAPCKEGQMKTIEVPPAPKADPVLAQELVRQKAALATLEAARTAREAQEQKREADRATAAHDQLCTQLRLDKQAADERANGGLPATRPALREKAQELGEALAAQCKS